jgi:HSP20 family protein
MRRSDARNLYYLLSAPSGEIQRGAWRPNTDICETDEHVIVCLEVPGVRPEDISVTEYGNRIVVRGVRRPDPSGQRKRYHQIEIVCGEFEKEIVLGGPLKGAPVEAGLSLGVLSLRISKTAAGKNVEARSIPIEA